MVEREEYKNKKLAFFMFLVDFPHYRQNVISRNVLFAESTPSLTHTQRALAAQ